MSPTLDLTKQLIACPSLTPNDAGCQEILAKRLQPLGFKIENMRFGKVDNLWARRGTEKPLFVFLGHTDVVPTGPEDQWHSPPFDPTIRDGHLYGRGAADMKSGIAAMIVAIERFIQTNPKHKGSVALLVTSDEEGESIDGVVKVIEKLESRKEKIDWCLVGEPSSQKIIGDTIKIGRRGSLHGKLTLHGVQGHIAYPDKAANPIHLFANPLSLLSAEVWDKGNKHFPPTTFQISNVHSGTGATNVIPGQLEARFNFRFSTENTPEQLKSRVHTLLDQCKVKYDIEWTLSGIPFLTREGALLKAICQAIKKETNIDTELSTIGGTSDGRFVAPTGAEVIEFGLLNATIHKIDECVKVDDLEILTNIYGRILELLLAR